MTNKTSEQNNESAPTKKPNRNAVHIILQGKGGVGKSYVSSIVDPKKQTVV
jgi:predicted GTPase